MISEERARELRVGKETIYHHNGFENRQEYLDDLADDYGDIVYELADILGPNEDFDGLVNELQDHDMLNEL